MPGRRGSHLVAAAVVLLLTGGAGAAEPAGRLIDGPAGKLYVEVHGNAPGRPLLIVNGGPGFDHGYLLLSPVWDEIVSSPGRPTRPSRARSW